MKWNYPTTIWIGENQINYLRNACEILKIQNPLFVTDKDLINLPMVKKIIKDLESNLKPIIFSNFSGNPVGENVEEGVKIYNNSKCDGVIAFGGGSGLDVGKAIAFMSKQTRVLWDFEDIGDFWTRASNKTIPPIVAVPTTAGTGSETGRASAIINKVTGIKKIIFHPKMMPSIVILDPNLTINLSPRLTAATGMDALAHNLEAYFAPGFHPMADGIAIAGIKLIKNSLLKAFHDGKNIKARMNLLSAASMGSTAFQKGLGAIHSLSHPINAEHDIHHGLSNAIFMPYVFTFNRSSIENKIIDICEFLNLDKNFNAFIEWILYLRKELNIPHKLSEVLEVSNIDLETLSKKAYEDPSTAGNPKKITKEDLKKIYEFSLEGKLFE